jgi:predicted DsbA family dithiol-disulfide isomerase
MAERFDKAIIQESKEPHNIDTLLSIVEDVELDRAKLKKHLLKVGE